MTMTFDQDQQDALARINEGRNVFVTGSAGTGKSSVTVEAIRRRLGDRSLKVCATTGVAALNLRDKLAAMFGQHVDASTVYRWAGIGLGPRPGQTFEDYLRHMRGQKFQWSNACRRIRSTRTLVIDEVSMLPGRILEFVDFVCRAVREVDEPMGGIQVVAVGDFLQLPPVKNGDELRYDWAFQSPAWHALRFAPVTLRVVHRQDNPEFVAILNQVRDGNVSPAAVRVLNQRVARFPSSSILRLMTHNHAVDKWNLYQLGALDGREVTFDARGEGSASEVQRLQDDLTTPVHLTIKRRARVMVTANLRDSSNPDALAAANGELGTVVDWSSHSITVALDNGREIDVEPHEWTYDPTAESTGKFIQFPLRLAWACTIHKSQGLTLDRALLNIRAAIAPGQAYVAVSRVKTLGGLLLKDSFNGCSYSDHAKDFHRRIATGEIIGPAAPSLHA
jgi:ATP-dependent exoDNAse (exonuclease V) alpha subunit